MPHVNVRAAAQDAVTKDHPCLLWRTTSSTVHSSQLGSRCVAYMMHVPPAAANALRKSRLGRCCHSARKVVVLSPDRHIPQLSRQQCDGLHAEDGSRCNASCPIVSRGLPTHLHRMLKTLPVLLIHGGHFPL